MTRYIKYLAVALLLVVGLSTPTTARELQVNAAAGIIYNPQTQTVVWGQNDTTKRSIASLTKMMTAWVLFQSQPDLSQVITITRPDVRNASTTYLRFGDKVTLGDLLHLMLIGSDNAAARAIARSTSQDFVARMNAAAIDLGLLNTHYADPAGLLADNVSTAADVARMLFAVSKNTVVTSAMRMKVFPFRAGKRFVTVHSTDHLLGDDSVDVLAAKTGFTSHSGFCFAAMLHMSYGDDVVFVVLGAKTNAARFNEVRNLASWATTQFGDPLHIDEGVPRSVLSIGRVCWFPDTVSDEGVAFIKRHEGFRAKPYRDPARVWTVGYGMTHWKGRRVTRTYPRRITREQADEEFRRQLVDYETVVRDSVCFLPMSQSAYDSLVSLAWNLGRVNTLIVDKLAGSGDVEENDFLSTATVKSRLHPALIERRLQEYAMFKR